MNVDKRPRVRAASDDMGGGVTDGVSVSASSRVLLTK